MSVTDNYRRQHNEIVEVVQKIIAGLNVEKLKKDASTIRELLMVLSGKLKVHLTMEDKVLYPSLVNHSSEQVRQTAKKFVDEMGGIKQGFLDYIQKWSSRGSIENDAVVFEKETRDLFAALRKRVERENNELYPLLDNAEAE